MTTLATPTPRTDAVSTLRVDPNTMIVQALELAEQLERELSAAHAELNRLSGMEQSARLAEAEARAELAEAREDGERLDWLELNPIHEWGFGYAPGTITMNGQVYWTLRAAIDAARKEVSP